MVIVDYGLGNLGSIANMCARLGIEAKLSSQPADLLRATRLILPGVGHFDRGMENLESMGLIAPLSERVVEQRTPILGICLGAQLMTRSSEEGDRPGLGWVDARTVRFNRNRLSASMKVPHMGWTDVSVERKSPLFPDPGQPRRFYFVHSYHFECANRADVASTSSYGYEFASAFAAGNVYGVQFHPEKSHRFGMALLKDFAAVV